MTRPHDGYVFGIGLSKTGTHSLNAALERLGWPSIHYPDPEAMLAGRFEEAMKGCRAATDITVAAVFERLDAAYPGSKFILTVRRDTDRWLESVSDHYRRRKHELEGDTSGARYEARRICFGMTGFDAEQFRDAARAHERRACAYFAHRPDDMLVMDPCAGDGYASLCPYLGVPMVDEAFPRRNARTAPA